MIEFNYVGEIFGCYFNKFFVFEVNVKKFFEGEFRIYEFFYCCIEEVSFVNFFEVKDREGSVKVCG